MDTSLGKTKQCAHFRHTLPLTKRQTDRQIYVTRNRRKCVNLTDLYVSNEESIMNFLIGRQFPWPPYLAQNATNWCNAHTHMECTHSKNARIHSHTDVNTVTNNHVVRSASSAITEFGIKFLFSRYLREGE